MTEQRKRTLPRWIFAILAAGGFITCGIYFGLLRAGEGTTGQIVRAIVFGIFGILMMWGVLGRRDS